MQSEDQTGGPVALGIGGAEIVDRAKMAAANAGEFGALRRLSAYAGPLLWGPELIAGSHIGSVTFSISYEGVGDTKVFGKVTYWKGSGDGILVTEEFIDDTSITTSKSVANVICQFKGIPFGSAVNVVVRP